MPAAGSKRETTHDVREDTREPAQATTRDPRPEAGPEADPEDGSGNGINAVVNLEPEQIYHDKLTRARQKVSDLKGEEVTISRTTNYESVK